MNKTQPSCLKANTGNKGESSMPIYVKSEIAPLKRVMLHRPGQELEHLTPNTLDRLLFDDIPYLEVAQQEHDRFAEILKKNGIDTSHFQLVKYLRELIFLCFCMIGMWPVNAPDSGEPNGSHLVFGRLCCCHQKRQNEQ